MLRDLGTMKTGVEIFGKLRNVVMEENGDDKMVREINRWSSCREDTSENILRKKGNCIDQILRRDYLLHYATEGVMTEMKGVGRRRTKLLDDLRNRRIYLVLKEEAKDRKDWNDSLSIEYMEEIQIIFHKSIALLISRIFNNNETIILPVVLCDFEAWSNTLKAKSIWK